MKVSHIIALLVAVALVAVLVAVPGSGDYSPEGGYSSAPSYSSSGSWLFESLRNGSNAKTDDFFYFANVLHAEPCYFFYTSDVSSNYMSVDTSVFNPLKLNLAESYPSIYTDVSDFPTYCNFSFPVDVSASSNIYVFVFYGFKFTNSTSSPVYLDNVSGSGNNKSASPISLYSTSTFDISSDFGVHYSFAGPSCVKCYPYLYDSAGNVLFGGSKLSSPVSLNPGESCYLLTASVSDVSSFNSKGANHFTATIQLYGGFFSLPLYTRQHLSNDSDSVYLPFKSTTNIASGATFGSSNFYSAITTFMDCKPYYGSFICSSRPSSGLALSDYDLTFLDMPDGEPLLSPGYGRFCYPSPSYDTDHEYWYSVVGFMLTNKSAYPITFYKPSNLFSSNYVKIIFNNDYADTVSYSYPSDGGSVPYPFTRQCPVYFYSSDMLTKLDSSNGGFNIEPNESIFICIDLSNMSRGMLDFPLFEISSKPYQNGFFGHAISGFAGIETDSTTSSDDPHSGCCCIPPPAWLANQEEFGPDKDMTFSDYLNYAFGSSSGADSFANEFMEKNQDNLNKVSDAVSDVDYDSLFDGGGAGGLTDTFNSWADSSNSSDSPFWFWSAECAASMAGNSDIASISGEPPKSFLDEVNESIETMKQRGETW